MLIRASIVLLIVLNLGVAAWWIAGPAGPGTEVAPGQPEGVTRLELVNEGAGPGLENTAKAPSGPAGQMPHGAATASGSAAAGAGSACFSVGPFIAEAAAMAAADRLRDVATTTRTRSVPATGASAYNVFLSPAADRAQAQATAERIGAAGFDDFLVVNSGDMANSVALGRYGSLEMAQRRQASLQAAGFAAEVGAVGATTPAQWWLDARARAQFSLQDARAMVGAAAAQELDCGSLL